MISAQLCGDPFASDAVRLQRPRVAGEPGDDLDKRVVLRLLKTFMLAVQRSARKNAASPMPGADSKA